MTAVATATAPAGALAGPSGASPDRAALVPGPRAQHRRSRWCCSSRSPRSVNPRFLSAQSIKDLLLGVHDPGDHGGRPGRRDHHPQRRPVGRLGARPVRVRHRQSCSSPHPGTADPGRARSSAIVLGAVVRRGQRRPDRARRGCRRSSSPSARSTSSGASTTPGPAASRSTPPTCRPASCGWAPRPCSACPVLTLFAVAVVIVAGFVLRSYRAGRDLYAIGSDPDAARLSGIPVGRRVFFAFVTSGALAGLAGVLYAARFGTLDANAGLGSELNVVAAVVVGGVAIFGGSGSVYGAALGAVLLTTIGAALPVLGVSPFWQRAAVGALHPGRDRPRPGPGGPGGQPAQGGGRPVVLGSTERSDRAAHLLLGRRRASSPWSLVAVVGAPTIDGVASPRFWRFVTLEIIPIALIALPMTLIVITGEIDLSVASMLGLTCTVMGQLWFLGRHLAADAHRRSAWCWARCSARSTARSSRCSGCRRWRSRSARSRSTADSRYVVLGDRAVADYPTDWTTRSRSQPIPGTHHPVVRSSWWPCWRSCFGVVLHATPIGRGLYAMGNNADAATFAGINVARDEVLAVRGVRHGVGAGRGVLDAAVRQRPRRQRHRPRTVRRRRRCCSAGSPSSAAGAAWSASSPRRLARRAPQRAAAARTCPRTR